MTYHISVSLADQTVWFFFSIVVGALIMLVYTLTHGIARILFSHPLLIAVSDVFCFILIFAIEFGCVIFLPQNTLRWFYLLGQIIGGIVFRLLVSPHFYAVFRWIDKKKTKITKLPKIP